jgi:hypothetical protein
MRYQRRTAEPAPSAATKVRPVNAAFTDAVLSRRMPHGVLPKLGLAAVVLFAPGGFILGAGLAARWWRQRAPRGD